MNDTYNSFIEWSSKPEGEKALARKADEFEEMYFSDLTLKDLENELTAYKATIGDVFVELTEDLVDVGDLTIQNWRIVISENTEEYAGKCLPETKSIEITSKYKDDDLVLLHEMIHAYEVMLAHEKYEKYPQLLTIKLFEKLKPSFPKIIEWIIMDNHIFTTVHYPLFMLKALDLDLRLNKPPGSVYGYAREEMFK